MLHVTSEMKEESTSIVMCDESCFLWWVCHSLIFQKLEVKVLTLFFWIFDRQADEPKQRGSFCRFPKSKDLTETLTSKLLNRKEIEIMGKYYHEGSVRKREILKYLQLIKYSNY